MNNSALTPTMTTLELAKANPAAFQALPAPYQADDCLMFWIAADGYLCCTPKPDQVPALGEWACHYEPEFQEWVQ